MALLENLVAGNVYIVKISASNEVGEGPFSNSVELAVLPKDTSESNQRPKRLDSSDAKGLDVATVTGAAFFFFNSLILDFSPHACLTPEPELGLPSCPWWSSEVAKRHGSLLCSQKAAGKSPQTDLSAPRPLCPELCPQLCSQMGWMSGRLVGRSALGGSEETNSRGGCGTRAGTSLASIKKNGSPREKVVFIQKNS